MEEGDIFGCFVKDVGLALPPKMRAYQSQALKEVKIRKAFTAGRENMAISFWTSRFQVLQGMFVRFPQILEERTA